MSEKSWIEEELSLANFEDSRLNKRFKFIANELASNPAAPINHASTDWAATKAAYRFFDNDKVNQDNILEPHFLNTTLRSQSYKKLIVVQDTSMLTYNTHLSTGGLGSVGKRPNGYVNQGLILHASLVLTEKGLPLGLIDANTYARVNKHESDSHKRKMIPIEKKESFKWQQSLRNIDERFDKQEIITVCDREADIYSFQEECLDRGIDFVVRCNQGRMLEDEKLGDIGLMDRLAVEPIADKITIEIPGTGKRKARKATLDLRFLPITYAGRPRGSGSILFSDRSDLSLSVVHLQEEKPPKGEKALSWILVTSLPVKSKKDALEISKIYQLRWNIELYFKCLKTGCGVEKCRLNDGKKLIRFVSLMAVVAWRILWMQFLNRSDGEASCECFLTKQEWQALWLKRHRKAILAEKIGSSPPKQAPCVRDAVRWIAMMGGFLGRKNDGEPGLITIWRGWQSLNLMVEGYEMSQK